MFYRSAADNKLASLEARIAKLENRISKRAGHQVADPKLVAFQVKELQGAFGREADVLVVAPLRQFPSTHVIKVIKYTKNFDEVSIDIHLNGQIIIEIACYISSRVNKNVAYDSPTLEDVLGQDTGLNGAKLNYMSADELALMTSTL